MRGNRHYVQLAIMTALSFISMYVLMYAMVTDSRTSIAISINSTWPD